MKKLILLASATILVPTAVAQMASNPPAFSADPAPGAPDWENQAVFRVNKEEPHATKMPFPDAAGALSKTRMESPWCRLLNSDTAWKICWAPHPDLRPLGFEKPGYDDSAWKTIPVPANVELHGYGTPIYTNITYVFKKAPPRVTDDPDPSYTTYAERNPVSSYRRAFTVPADWKGRQTFITFNGVSSAFYLYVNGEKVGYSQDSRTPAEFNITPHLRADGGENLLAVEVYRYSDGSYLEDQDMWNLSGIFRDVYLWSSDALDLRDFEVVGTLDDDCKTGLLAIKTWTRDHAAATRGPHAFTIEATLTDAAGNTIARLNTAGQTATTDTVSEMRATFPPGAGTQILPYSAETPALYTLLLTLKNASGNAVAHYAIKTGFQRSEIKNGNFLVNGRPVLIKGVNRHDFDHIHGQYVPESTMRAELDAMKRLNINTIRTAHYPNDPRFLELVDEYGFYVISEANIESHGMGYGPDSLAKDPKWGPAHLDRVRNMVELLKNHPSIVMWSLGNEAGDGINFEECSKWVHNRWPRRPVHYEQGAEKAHVDLFTPMYYRIANLAEWCRKQEKLPLEKQRPMIQCEYSHMMGNSGGGFAEYWEHYRRERLLQGGSIWDWRDQGILRAQTFPATHRAAVAALDPATYVAPDGSLRYFAYGGDYGDWPNDDNFCCNGIMAANLTPHPHAAEVFHQYRNLHVTPADLDSPHPRLRVFSENFFRTLTAQKYTWTLLEDGVAVQSGTATLPTLAPQQTVEIAIPLAARAKTPGAEYHLNIEFLQGEDHPWAPANHVIACEQIVLAWTNVAGSQPVVPRSAAPLATTRAHGLTTISGKNFSATFDDRTAQITSYKIDDNELLAAPLQMNFWRASTDNDRGNKMPVTCASWRTAGENSLVKCHQYEPADSESDIATLTYDLTVPVGKTTAAIEYKIAGDGAIAVSLRVHPEGEKLPAIPRIGMTCALRPEYQTWTWFGRGPVENHIDRATGAPVGRWSGPVAKLWHPYVEPGETANRTGIRWSEFTDAKGNGLRVRTADGQHLEMAVYPFAQSDLENRRHPTDIPLRELVTIQITHKQMGVGGENSWSTWPLTKYRLFADKEYAYSYTIEPLRLGNL